MNLFKMALSKSRQAKSLLSLHKSALQRLNCSFMEDPGRAHFSSYIGQDEFPKWRKLDSRNCGIARSKIPVASWLVLKLLREQGFEAYLVGGCVRDLLLNKVPKDFDVITTAGLKQVKKKFYRSIIIGKRFPICKVTIKGSELEVSSFDTLAKESGKEKVHISQMPKGCDPLDIRRWENCLQRDFTVNSLFFDPFRNTIYDYTNAMMDLKSLKLRTVKPALLSFKEDQARILRGLRLAARLNLSFSDETEDALNRLSSTVAELSMSRILMEMNYMLSYGAAERSLLLLKRFQLLDILLPFHAAYLSKQVQNQVGVHSSMLMRLFFNLDQLITCDQPCTESLWVAILAFHQALYSNPQHPVVVLTIASLLHHRTLKESIKFGRQNAPATKVYIPEIEGAVDDLLDGEIVEKVTQFVGQVKNSVDGLINKKCLLESMASFPEFPCSGLVFVPQKMGEKVEQIFYVLPDGVSFVKAKERSQEIQQRLLTEGNVNEVRFVLGKIITATLVHSRKQAKEAVAEAGADDLHPPEKFNIAEHTRTDLRLTNSPQKSNVAEKTENTSGYLRALFSMPNNKKKRSTKSSNQEELSDNATKKARLSKNNTTAASSLSEIVKDERVKAETRSNRSVVSGLSK